MKESDLKRIAMLSALVVSTAACNTVAVQASTDSEGATPYPTSTMPVPEITSTVDVAELAHLPPARETAIVATANAYDPESLIERGFPPEAIRSQRYLKPVFNLLFEVNGEGWQYDNQYNQGGSTIVKTDKPGFENHIYVITAGHLFDPEEVGESYMQSIAASFGPVNAKFTAVDLKTIQIGDDLTLTREKFGIVHAFDEESILDYAFIAIPKENIPPNVLEKLMQDAISTDKISFDKITENDRVVGVCEPKDTGFRGVPAEDARYIDDQTYTDDTTGLTVTGHAIIVQPWLTGGGCSGEGPFVVDDNGDAKLLGINVANYWDDTEYWDAIAIYPYSDMGEQGFWDNLTIAIESSLLNK